MRNNIELHVHIHKHVQTPEAIIQLRQKHNFKTNLCNMAR